MIDSDTSPEHVGWAHQQWPPGSREVALLTLLTGLLFVGTILAFGDYHSTEYHFGDSSAYTDITSAIRHWNLRGNNDFRSEFSSTDLVCFLIPECRILLSALGRMGGRTLCRAQLRLDAAFVPGRLGTTGSSIDFWRISRSTPRPLSSCRSAGVS